MLTPQFPLSKENPSNVDVAFFIASYRKLILFAVEVVESTWPIGRSVSRDLAVPTQVWDVVDWKLYEGSKLYSVEFRIHSDTNRTRVVMLQNRKKPLTVSVDRYQLGLVSWRGFLAILFLLSVASLNSNSVKKREEKNSLI